LRILSGATVTGVRTGGPGRSVYLKTVQVADRG